MAAGVVAEIDDLPPATPDGRYIVVRGRLWRASNPSLSEEARQVAVDTLMAARRAVRAAKGNPEKLAKARTDVDKAKQQLGERGPVWWTDDAPDHNRHLAKNTPYAEWYATLQQA